MLGHTTHHIFSAVEGNKESPEGFWRFSSVNLQKQRESCFNALQSTHSTGFAFLLRMFFSVV